MRRAEFVQLARVWGCTPAQLRACTLSDIAAMYDLLADEQAAREEAEVEARLRHQQEEDDQ